MIRDLKCTEFQATLSFSAYGLGLGVVPMVISSLSEEFGRLPLFLWSSIGFELCFVMIALYVWYIVTLKVISDFVFQSMLGQGAKHSSCNPWQIFTGWVFLDWGHNGWGDDLGYLARCRVSFSTCRSFDFLLLAC
jgi:MFS family permease